MKGLRLLGLGFHFTCYTIAVERHACMLHSMHRSQFGLSIVWCRPLVGFHRHCSACGQCSSLRRRRTFLYRPRVCSRRNASKYKSHSSGAPSTLHSSGARARARALRARASRTSSSTLARARAALRARASRMPMPRHAFDSDLRFGPRDRLQHLRFGPRDRLQHRRPAAALHHHGMKRA